MYDAAENDDFDREEIPTYEEVAKLYPRPGLYRPVVLIGPPGVGRNELKRRLMATDPEKYKTPVPCKSFSQDKKFIVKNRIYIHIFIYYKNLYLYNLYLFIFIIKNYKQIYYRKKNVKKIKFLNLFFSTFNKFIKLNIFTYRVNHKPVF